MVFLGIGFHHPHHTVCSSRQHCHKIRTAYHSIHECLLHDIQTNILSPWHTGPHLDIVEGSRSGLFFPLSGNCQGQPQPGFWREYLQLADATWENLFLCLFIMSSEKYFFLANSFRLLTCALPTCALPTWPPHLYTSLSGWCCFTDCAELESASCTPTP